MDDLPPYDDVEVRLLHHLVERFPDKHTTAEAPWDDVIKAVGAKDREHVRTSLELLKGDGLFSDSSSSEMVRGHATTKARILSRRFDQRQRESAPAYRLRKAAFKILTAAASAAAVGVLTAMFTGLFSAAAGAAIGLIAAIPTTVGALLRDK